MVDEETKKFLESWKLDANVVQRFEAHGIQKNMIKNLTPALMKELLPEIGPRMAFEAKWKESFRPKKRKHDVTDDDSDTESHVESDSGSDTETVKPNTSTAESPYALKRQTCFVGTEMYKRLQRPNVQQILNNSEQGRKIVEGYKNLSLSHEARENVLEIIISDVINSVKGKLNKHDFYDIAKGIVQVFPKESLDLYYVAPVQKKHSRTKKSISVRGKVAIAYQNRMQRTVRALKACREKTDTANGKKNETLKEPSEETKESIAWLESNQEPWDIVQAHWTVTAQVRLDDIRKSGTGKVDEFIKKWPILRHPRGWTLIQDDFKSMQLCTIEGAIDHWPKFFKRVEKAHAGNKKKILRAKNLRDMLKGDLNDGAKSIVQLSLLSYMIPPKGRIRSQNGKHWKPSMIECEESLVMHTVTANDVSRIRDERVKSMQQLNLTVQPYVIVVGPTLDNINTYFVSVDNILYSVPSAFEAIDTCFKAFHVLNAEYPPASAHLWYLIQRELYKFTTKYDKKPPHVLEVITALRALTDSESEGSVQ